MILRRLFECLWENNVTIIATSNRKPDDLYLNGLQRELFLPCIELIKKVRVFTFTVDSVSMLLFIGIVFVSLCVYVFQNSKVIDFDSATDYRFGGERDTTTYFYPNDDAAMKSMCTCNIHRAPTRLHIYDSRYQPLNSIRISLCWWSNVSYYCGGIAASLFNHLSNDGDAAPTTIAVMQVRLTTP